MSILEITSQPLFGFIYVMFPALFISHNPSRAVWHFVIFLRTTITFMNTSLFEFFIGFQAIYGKLN